MRNELRLCTVLFATATTCLIATGQTRPTVETTIGIDTSCFTITQTGDTATGTFAWRRKVDSNGKESWVCANDPQPRPMSISPTAVWTSTTSDKQLQYFRQQVIAAVQAAVKDSIVTKDQIKKLVDDHLTEIVKAEVAAQIAKLPNSPKQ